MINTECGLNLNRAYRELQPHGTLQFPCASFSLTYHREAADTIPWHWHDELEIIHMTNGNLRLQIPGKTFHLKKGDLFFINSNILHSAVSDPSCEIHSLVYSRTLVAGSDTSIFADRYLTPLISCPSFDGLLLPEEQQKEWNISGVFSTAFDAIGGEYTGYEFIVRESLSQLCLALYRYYRPDMDLEQQVPTIDHLRTKIMLDYIHTHFSDPIGLPQISQAAGIGTRECLRCFGRIMKLSPIQYLLKYRIMQGASMLSRDNGCSVSQISSRCGFDSPSHFSQVFKRLLQCTPREYRKNLQGGLINPQQPHGYNPPLHP